MTFEVEVAGRTFPVSIERMDGPRFRVSVAGVPRVVEVVRPDEFSLLLLTEASAAGDASGREKGTVAGVRKTTDFQLAPGPGAGEVLVGLEGRTISVTLNGRRSAQGLAGPSTVRAGGPRAARTCLSRTHVTGDRARTCHAVGGRCVSGAASR